MVDQDWRSVISDDRRSAVVTLPQGSSDEATLAFADVDELDRLVQMMSVVRAQLLPSLPMSPHDADISMTKTPPVWAALRTRQNGKRPLLLRHPGLGWLGFLLDDENATALATALTASLDP